MIRPFLASDVPAVKKLTDRVVGQNYYQIEELEKKQRQSLMGNLNASFVLVLDNEIVGIRISFPPGQWEHGKGLQLFEERWPQTKDNTAYFQSIFLAPEVQKQGWGQKLSQNSLEILKQMGAKGVVCHSWVESPGQSSLKYLKKMGFESVATCPNYWKNVDYTCVRCGKPCLCTAEEMYLNLSIGVS